MSGKNRKRTILLFFEILGLVILLGMIVLFFISEDKNRQEKRNATVALALTAEELKGTNVSDDASDHIDVSRYGELLADEERCRAEHIYAKDTISPDEVKLLFAGDISFAEGYDNMGRLAARGGEISSVFSEETLSIMREADIFMVNNEFTYTTRGTPSPGKQYTLRSNPDNVRYLFDMGVDIVALANNHTYDYGEVSLTDTLDTLESVEMPYVGAGRNISEAIKPTYFIANDLKIAIINATQIEKLDYPDTPGATEDSPGTFRCWFNDRVLDVIREAKNNSDYVVVYVHWGNELEEEIDWAQAELAPKLADAGADIIIGDHPHILQKIDYVGGVPVIYSLGNYWFNGKNRDTGLLEVIVGEEGAKSIRFIPATEPDCTTTVATGAEKERILEHMRSISGGVNIDEEGYVTAK